MLRSCHQCVTFVSVLLVRNLLRLATYIEGRGQVELRTASVHSDRCTLSAEYVRSGTLRRRP